MSLLRRGETLQVGGNNACKVIELLGEGGQGEVYRAELDGREMALKWYFRSFATQPQRDQLMALVTVGAPSPNFLWPLALVQKGKGTLGYLMPLRGRTYEGIPALLKGRIDPTFHALCAAGCQIAHAFLQLHSKGFCYRDISLGNAFIEPESGDIQICDNDNVGGKASRATVVGTPRFIAPEILLKCAPLSTETDLFSLSVLLFYFFMLHHPFEGKLDSQVHCLDSPAMDRLYVENPVFIFDPENRSNEPDPKYHRRVISYWKLYPEALRRLFLRAFTVGIHNPDARVRESEWRSELAAIQAWIVPCSCGAENFFDPEAPAGTYCWNPACGVKVKIPPRLKLGNRLVTLPGGRKIVKHHLDGTSYDFGTLVGEVVSNPNAPEVWGIRNQTTAKWVVSLPGGVTRDIEPGRTIAILPGTTIAFGKAMGEIVA